MEVSEKTKEWKSELLFYLNGKKIVIQDTEAADTPLLAFLRSRGIGLTGTKLGCGEGGCGACSVMLSRYNRETKRVEHRAINACLTLLGGVDGCHVVTIEGLGSIKSPHIVQRRIAEYHGSQCGFCTPGIVMALYAFLRQHPEATQHDIEESFDGNLCRCTGYRPILDAAKTFASDYKACGESACGTGNCCKKSDSEKEPEVKKPKICPGSGLPCACDRVEDAVDGGIKVDFPDSPCDPIFPPFLKTYEPKPLAIHFVPKIEHPEYSVDGTHIVDSQTREGEKPMNSSGLKNSCSWYRPTSIEHLLHLKNKFPEGRIVAGATEITIELNGRRNKFPYPQFFSPFSVPELNKIEVFDDFVRVGAAVSLSKISETIGEMLKTMPEPKTRALRAIHEQLKLFAGTQIRNMACLGGNIATASPISDINPVLLACGAKLNVQSFDEKTETIHHKTLTIDRHFFLGYRKTLLSTSDLIVTVDLPFSNENEYFAAYKQSRRRDDDIAIASAAFKFVLEKTGQDTHKIQKATLVYGGMAPFTKQASEEIENFLIGKEISFDQSTMQFTTGFETIYTMLEKEYWLDPNAPGGMIHFRRSLVLSFFFKFLDYLRGKLAHVATDETNSVIYNRPVSQGTHLYKDAHKVDLGSVGKPEMHVSSMKQVTGEAKYVDDIPNDMRGLYAAFVWSEEPHAKILSVDTSAASHHDGFIAYYDHRDITGKNQIGPVFNDEELFASQIVPCIGYPIGMVVAKSLKLAQQAAKLVTVTYEKLPCILTIPEAIEAKSFFPEHNYLSSGTVDDDTFSKCDHVIEGDFTMGGQEHFYLEPQSCLVIPEEDELTVISSTQNPSKTQMKVADVLGIPASHVVCKLKRIGGGFGGKETRSVYIAVATALAAHKLRVPVRMVLDRDEDMSSSGTRHPYYSKYKVGFSKEGKIIALKADMYSNAGCTRDLSLNVGERSLFSLTNTYYIPNVHAEMHLCKTNWQSATAFRGFGAPQSILLMENIIEHISSTLNIPSNTIREANFIKEGQKTHYGQSIKNCTIEPVWNHMKQMSQYDSRKEQVIQFNSRSNYIKRGIACMPVQFGLSFTFKMMNQAGALVHLYQDGTALVTTGGVEMGQGLNTKMIQIAAEALRLPIEKVHIAETATDKVPNTMPSAASVSADLNGMAVYNACQTLMERLKPYLDANPGLPMKDIIVKAHFDRVQLSATGFYATPIDGYNWAKHEGTPFAYFVWGAACSEVEIDCLTGNHSVVRTDIVMDLGQSISPAIDIGQIEGAFAQGYGLTTLEEIVVDGRHTRTPGRTFTRGPSTYKIPSFKDVPLQLNVHLLPNAHNPGTIHSSKGVGEPPLVLGASVYLAIKDAISAALQDQTRSNSNFVASSIIAKTKTESPRATPIYINLESPATCERIRMACIDKITELIQNKSSLPN